MARYREKEDDSIEARIGEMATLSVIALAWIAIGALIILGICEVSPSFAAAWRAPTLTVLWLILSWIALSVITMMIALAFLPSVPEKTASQERAPFR